jgi:molybdopterin/thiamine biosynthesis adenylyltransferase
MSVTLAITGDCAGRLFGALSDPDETAWVLSARLANDGALLLGRALSDVPNECYLERGPRRLEITSLGFVPAFRAAQRDGCIPVFVHTHPGGVPRASAADAGVDAALSEFARARELSGYAALIVGGTAETPTFTGYIATSAGRREITRLRVAGRDLRVLLAHDLTRATPAPIFDRQVRAFGADGQRLLSALRVGVVGAGGTGSPTVEQLARLGVGELLIVDDDTVDDTNLTRIHGSTVTHIGLPKADLAAGLARSYGTGVTVHSTVEAATRASVVESLATCDIVFGCTDDQAGRLVLSRLAYHFLIPVYDCGVIVDAAEGHVRGVVGRITLVVPGEPCLVCRGQVDPRRAGEEMMDPERRRELAGLGYATAEAGPAPAVVAFTTLTSAHAVSDLLGRLFGYAQSTATQLLIRIHAQEISRAGRPAQPGHYCADHAEWGCGATTPLLGITGLR